MLWLFSGLLYSRTTTYSTTTLRGYFLINMGIVIATAITITIIIYVGPGQNDPKFHLRQETVKLGNQLNIFVKHLLNRGIMHPRRRVRDAAESAQRKCNDNLTYRTAFHQTSSGVAPVGGCSSPKFFLVPLAAPKFPCTVNIKPVTYFFIIWVNSFHTLLLCITLYCTIICWKKISCLLIRGLHPFTLSRAVLLNYLCIPSSREDKIFYAPNCYR